MKINKKTLSLVIPMYNEVERLPLAIEVILRGLQTKTLKLTEVVMVNDGSTDKTLNLIKKYAKVSKIPVRVVSYVGNRGKGYAVRRGMSIATSEYALLADVDMSTPFSELLKLDTFVAMGDQVVVGTRKNGESTVMVAQSWHRQIMGKIFTKITQIILGVKVSDFTCGFKLFARPAYKLIFTNSYIERWGYDAEILFLAQKYGFEISEKALLWYNDARTKVSIWRDVVQTMKELVQIRLNDMRGVYSLPSERVTLRGKVLSLWNIT